MRWIPSSAYHFADRLKAHSLRLVEYSTGWNSPACNAENPDPEPDQRTLSQA